MSCLLWRLLPFTMPTVLFCSCIGPHGGQTNVMSLKGCPTSWLTGDRPLSWLIGDTVLMSSCMWSSTERLETAKNKHVRQTSTVVNKYFCAPRGLWGYFRAARINPNHILLLQCPFSHFRSSYRGIDLPLWYCTSIFYISNGHLSIYFAQTRVFMPTKYTALCCIGWNTATRSAEHQSRHRGFYNWVSSWTCTPIKM